MRFDWTSYRATMSIGQIATGINNTINRNSYYAYQTKYRAEYKLWC